MRFELDAADPARRLAALAALGAAAGTPDARELAALVDCLAADQKLVQRRAAETCAALAARGVAVEAALRAALAAPPLRLRWGAAYALAQCGRLPLDAQDTLLEVMGLADGDLRWAAADLLKRLAAVDRDGIAARLLAAAGQPGPARKMALYCLRDLRAAGADAVAAAALRDDPDAEVRLAALAVLAVATVDRPAAAARIAALLDDPDPRLRRAAAGTLGGMAVATDEVLAALRRAQSSDDASLARAASAALRRLTG